MVSNGWFTNNTSDLTATLLQAAAGDTDGDRDVDNFDMQ